MNVLVTGSNGNLGCELRREMLYRLLREELAARGVKIRLLYERSDAPVREKEGLKPFAGFYAAPGLLTEDAGGWKDLYMLNTYLPFSGARVCGFYQILKGSRLTELRTTASEVPLLLFSC